MRPKNPTRTIPLFVNRQASSGLFLGATIHGAHLHFTPEYRIYELDDKGQSSEPPSVEIWKDDNEAQKNARMLFGSRAFEIWCGERKVGTIKPGVSRAP